MATATLRTVGNSVAVVIPKQWLAVLKLQAGSQVELALDGSRLTLQAPIKKPRKKYTLEQMLAECDPNAPYPEDLLEWDDMPVVGREVW
ncbi:AbrB/MazE/SpoVT family DNA-binding domain-containing protein [Thiothrix eikelboomii]|uniref:AbrB/MazE/SpoVT family DNA-binding domain-containing protein n=1 Tax=Thiothrix eikelboomii TaxID=92487 RepID=UPI003BB03A96